MFIIQASHVIITYVLCLKYRVPVHDRVINYAIIAVTYYVYNTGVTYDQQYDPNVLKVQATSAELRPTTYGSMGECSTPIDIREYIDCSLARPACLVSVE